MIIAESEIRELIREVLTEAKKRDYKAEYKKFQSSPKMKKYRAELNKYNRDKGTYGNGDKKDASHKGGKIVGFEEQSKNRGRAEKSRLKKEGVTGQYKVSPKVQMHWGMDKVVIISGNKRVVLNRKEIKSLMKGLKANKLGEGKLTETWDGPQGWSSKEAKKVVDGAVKNYAKDLRKVQYRVVKDWMTKAKSGVIDFFDIQRGLTTGDIKRAHPYETDFLQKVLTRDKIVDRFRNYYGGKKGMKSRVKPRARIK